MSAPSVDPPRAPSPTRTLVLSSLAYFMVILDALVVVTALPTIQHDLGGSLTSLEWIVTAYLLAFGAGIIPAASLGDRFGRRRLFVVGVGLFSAASAAGALAPSLSLLIAARVAQGIGAAIIAPLSLALLTAAVAPERRGSAIGLWGGIGGVGVAAGPLVGGAVVQGLNWHWIFWINVPIGIAVALLAPRFVAESRGADRTLDTPGAVLAAASGGGLLWALARGDVVGWTSPEVLLTGIVGAVLFAAFVLWERRTHAPMIPLHFFRNRTFAAANAVGFLSLGSLFAAAFFVTEYFQTVLGYSPLQAGLRFLPWTAMPLIVAPLAGRWADRIGARPLAVAGLLLQAAGLGAIDLLVTTSTSYTLLVVPFVLSGVGVSLALPATPLAAFGAVRPHEAGKASGVLNSLQRFGAAFVVAIATSVFTSQGHVGTAGGFLAGFRPAIEVSVVLSVMGAVVALAIARPRPAPSPVPGAIGAAAFEPTGL